MKVMDVEFDAKRDRAEIADPSAVVYWTIATVVPAIIGMTVVVLGPAFIGLMFLLHPGK